jgi:hypothetical protein
MESMPEPRTAFAEAALFPALHEAVVMEAEPDAWLQVPFPSPWAARLWVRVTDDVARMVDVEVIPHGRHYIALIQPKVSYTLVAEVAGGRVVGVPLTDAGPSSLIDPGAGLAGPLRRALTWCRAWEQAEQHPQIGRAEVRRPAKPARGGRRRRSTPKIPEKADAPDGGRANSVSNTTRGGARAAPRRRRAEYGT